MVLMGQSKRVRKLEPICQTHGIRRIRTQRLFSMQLGTGILGVWFFFFSFSKVLESCDISVVKREIRISHPQKQKVSGFQPLRSAEPLKAEETHSIASRATATLPSAEARFGLRVHKVSEQIA